MDLPDDVWMSVFDWLNEESCGYYTPASVIRWELAFLKCTSKHFYHLCRAYLARYAKLEDDLFGEDPDLQPEDQLCYYLAYRGYFNCLKYAHEHGCTFNKKTAWNAAQGGNLSCLKYVHEHGCEWSKKAPKMAASGGHLDCLKYAIDNGCLRDEDTTTGAIIGGHYDCFKYAVEASKCPVSAYITFTALKHRHYEVFQQLVQDGYEISNETLKEAAKSGNIECLKLSLSKIQSNKINKRDVGTAAVRSGSLESVIYLHQNDFPMAAFNCDIAIDYGHLDILRYLYNNGARPYISTCTTAARSGHLRVLQFLHENGEEWSTRTCAAAATRGDVKILQYLHENKCPWDADTTLNAAFSGSLACLKYAHENGCPWHEDTCDQAKNYEVVEYLHAKKCPCSHYS